MARMRPMARMRAVRPLLRELHGGTFCLRDNKAAFRGRNGIVDLIHCALRAYDR